MAERPGGVAGDAGRSRDRDPSGRPRNSRARDQLGRPLPRGEAGLPPLPDDLALGPEATLAEAQRLLDDGLPFRAHEVLEARWKAAPAAERELWQGLAQLAVGVTHARRGNVRGALALLRRAGARVAGYADRPPFEVDVDGLLGWVRRSTTVLEQRAADSPVDRSELPDPVLTAST